MLVFNYKFANLNIIKNRDFIYIVLKIVLFGNSF